MKRVAIVSAARTPIGTFGGALKDTLAVELGALVIKEVIRRAGIQPEQVEEVIMGHVLTGGMGMNTARQAAIRAGLGWWGKNTMVLIPGIGPWAVIGSVITDAELVPDQPLDRDCGACSAWTPQT